MNALRQAGAGKKIVLGHDWLTGMRGGERILEQFCLAFPEAPLVTLLANPMAVNDTIRNRTLHCSFLQRLPGVTRYYRHLLPLMPLAAETLRVPRGDLLLTASHCVAKSFRTPGDMRHLCCCFTPMRYAWLFQREYLGPVKSLLAAPLLAALRRWDARTSRRVDRYIAISRHVQQRIQRFYGRESDVVYPPVDTHRYTPASAPRGDYDLVVSALTPYKRIDLAVRAYRTANRSLKIVGIGSEMARLRELAGPRTEFLGWRDDRQVLDLYRHCRLLIFPGEEDFGIVPLEAMACGRPVVALARGGALETVTEGISGTFFNASTPESLRAAVTRAADTRWDPAAIRAQAERFGVSRFLDKMAVCVNKVLSAKKH